MAPGTERSVFDSNQNTEPIDKAPTCLLEMIGASWMSQAISVAAELRLADLMVNGSQSVDVLALATKCERASLHRLLRALTSLDLFIEQEDRTFSLTATGAWLRADAPQSVRSWAIWCGQYHWPLWADLLDSFRNCK